MLRMCIHNMLSAGRWTVVRRGFVPITVARPQRIFTVFRFSSQYLDKLIYNSGHGVKRRPAKNAGRPLLSPRAECRWVALQGSVDLGQF